MVNLFSDQEDLFQLVKEKIIEHNVTVIAHYYTDKSLQRLADETNGCVSDSLEMAKFGAKSKSNKIIVAGVKFMGETAKIISPEKRIFMPNLNATCSLDLGCSKEDFLAFCKKHPDREVVVYTNTSAEVKAISDWVVTSSIALDVIDYLDSKGKKIIWAPDRHLGHYIQKKTSADMVIWNTECIVHDEFSASELKKMKNLYPEAGILVHPESPKSVVELADFVGSTKQIINAANTMKHKQFIVATDRGIFYKMQQLCPNKEFIEAPTAGNGATCLSCARCPWMAMNSLEGILNLFNNNFDEKNEIHVSKSIIEQAIIPINKMLNFSVH